MTSAIIHSTINDLFPYPGEDNDSQTFRDNFNTIKQSLSSAATEISALQLHSASTNTNNDFNSFKISNAVFAATKELTYNFGSAVITDQVIDFNNGAYQIIKVGADIALSFTNLPFADEDNKVGHITVELTSDSALQFITLNASNGASISYDASYPRYASLPKLIANSTKPIIIEVWQHGLTIFVKVLTNSAITTKHELLHNFNTVNTAQVVDFNKGNYQLVKASADLSLSFANFPFDASHTGVGRVRLELTSDSSTPRLFTLTGATVKYDNTYPRVDTTPTLSVASATNPTIIEVWQYETTVYVKYIGAFS